MKIRTIIVCLLAFAALGGAIISGLNFATFDPDAIPTAWLFNIAACVLVLMLGFTVRGGAHGIALLLSVFAVCLPAVGPALAALSALAIHFMRPATEDEDQYKVGNPASARNQTGTPAAVLGRPLVESVRRLSQINQFRLLTGIGSLPPKHSRPVLTRLRDCDDAQLQLFAQGGLNDALESSERHLKALNQRTRSHPLEAATHCAIAEINLHLLDNHLIEEDDRPATWDAATEAIAKALKIDPQDALSLKICARLNLIGGAAEKAKLAAESLAKLPGHAENAKLLLAEAAFVAGEIDSVSDHLDAVIPSTSGSDDILDFWRKPKPTAYV